MKEDRRSTFTYQVSLGNIVQICVTVLGLAGFYYDLKSDVSLIKQDQSFTKTYVNEVREGFKEFKVDVSLWENEKNTDIARLKADVDNLKNEHKRNR
jgi:hypothetical protein